MHGLIESSVEFYGVPAHSARLFMTGRGFRICLVAPSVVEFNGVPAHSARLFLTEGVLGMCLMVPTIGNILVLVFVGRVEGFVVGRASSRSSPSMATQLAFCWRAYDFLCAS